MFQIQFGAIVVSRKHIQPASQPAGQPERDLPLPNRESPYIAVSPETTIISGKSPNFSRNYYNKRKFVPRAQISAETSIISGKSPQFSRKYYNKCKFVSRVLLL